MTEQAEQARMAREELEAAIAAQENATDEWLASIRGKCS